MSVPGSWAGMSRRRVRLFDAALIAWVAAWVVVGVYVGIDLHHLNRLATTLEGSGQALSQIAQALQGFTHIPLVGANLAKVVARIASTAQHVQTNAAVTKSSVDQLSYLLAVVIAVIPSVPALAVYLPMRTAWKRSGPLR